MQPQDTVMNLIDTTDIIRLPNTTTDRHPTAALVLLTDSRDLLYPVSQDEMINTQKTDPECKQYHVSVDKTESVYFINRYGFFVLHSKVDGAVQKVIPHTFVNLFLYPSLFRYPQVTMESITCMIRYAKLCTGTTCAIMYTERFKSPIRASRSMAPLSNNT